MKVFAKSLENTHEGLLPRVQTVTKTQKIKKEILEGVSFSTSALYIVFAASLYDNKTILEVKAAKK